jgi:DNA polymerase zeta
VNTRHKLLPDPSIDTISAIFYCLQLGDDCSITPPLCGCLAVEDDANSELRLDKLGFKDVETFEHEVALMIRFVDLVREWDPDVFTGYEIQKASWGYLVDRAKDLGNYLILLKIYHHAC